MNAGNLRHRISVMDRSMSQDGYGAAIPSWSEFAALWAEVKPAGGAESMHGDAPTPGITHAVTIRHTPGVKAQMRVIHLTRTLEIESVIDVDERHREMRLMCREVAA